MPVDESAQLEVLNAIAEALMLADFSNPRTPDDVRPAAERLLLMSSILWEQATLIRSEPMGESTLAGLHPVLRALVGMDDVVWDTIDRLRPKFVNAVRDRDATVREFILKSTSIALTPRDGLVPIHHAGAGIKSRESLAREQEDDARADVEAFYANYLKYRPAKLKTQSDVARAAGISVGTVATIEKLRAKPHYATVVKIAQAFGVTPEQMLTAP